MGREREEQLYRLQAELCQALAEPTMLKLLSLFGERPRAVKELIEATGERQAKISQHLAIMRQQGIVRTERAGTEVRYSLAEKGQLPFRHVSAFVPPPARSRRNVRPHRVLPRRTGDATRAGVAG